MTTCVVCEGARFVEAARVFNKVTGEGEKAVVGEFTPVPCWLCAGVPF